MILIPKAELIQDPASDLCDYYNNCDVETTDCKYLNHTTVCTCKAGYTPKENTDTKCKVKDDVCKTQVCEHGAKCMQHVDSGGFHCSCLKGWTGKYCSIEDKSVQFVPSNNSDKPNLMLIFVGGSLGVVILILLFVLILACRYKIWRASMIKNAQKIAMKNRGTNGFTALDYSARSIQNTSSNRTNGYDIRRDQQSGHPIQYEHTNSTTNIFAALQKQQKPTVHGSLFVASNGNANPITDEHVYMTIQDSHLSSNIGYSYTANNDRTFHLEEGTVRANPKPNYERLTHPESDVHHYKGIDARTTESRMVVGYNGNGGLSKDYLTPIYMKRTSYKKSDDETPF